MFFFFFLKKEHIVLIFSHPLVPFLSVKCDCRSMNTTVLLWFNLKLWRKFNSGEVASATQIFIFMFILFFNRQRGATVTARTGMGRQRWRGPCGRDETVRQPVACCVEAGAGTRWRRTAPAPRRPAVASRRDSWLSMGLEEAEGGGGGRETKSKFECEARLSSPEIRWALAEEDLWNFRKWAAEFIHTAHRASGWI